MRFPLIAGPLQEARDNKPKIMSDTIFFIRLSFRIEEMTIPLPKAE
jgi:hypothetical protein